MAINRHPLQANGAGQAGRQLPDEAVVGYCDALGDRLNWLAVALGEEQARGQLSAATAKAVHGFLHEIRATLMVMALKHGRQLLDVEPMPLTIDPTESGMPTFKDFWTLREDSERAQQQLVQIPERKALIEQAIDTIYSGQKPIKQQILWLQRAYMERLAATPVVADFRQQPPIRLGTRDRDGLYSVSWTGVVHSRNLFECSVLQFVERGGWHVTGGGKELSALVDTLSGGRHTLQEVLGLANEPAWIVPQTIERITIGPYHHRWTENDEFVQRAFAATNDEEPWMLRCVVERAATTQAAQRSTLDSWLGREPMEAGPSVKHTVLLVPLIMKQFLGDKDEYDQECAVYGVSKDGDLVC